MSNIEFILILISCAVFSFYVGKLASKRSIHVHSPAPTVSDVISEPNPFKNNRTVDTKNYDTRISEMLRHFLIDIGTNISIANRESKSSKALKQLEYALEYLKLLRKAVNLTNDVIVLEYNKFRYPQLTNQSERQVCAEVWQGMKYGYPFYYEGFLSDPNCTVTTKLEDLLTIGLNFVRGVNFKYLLDILHGLQTHHPGIRVLIAVEELEQQSIETKLNLTNFNLNISTVTFFHKNDVGVWHALVKYVSTKYLFIGQDLTLFDEWARLNRIVLMLDATDAIVVGGSHRNESGHWQKGCYQFKMINYKLKIIQGYDLSYNSCIYCDFISGPFVAKTKLLIKLLNDESSTEMTFIDLFLKLSNSGKSSMICPDSMFYTETLLRESEYSSDFWLSIGQNWLLYEIDILGKLIKFNCLQIVVPCRETGLILSPCCKFEISQMLKFAVETFNENGIDYEIQSGTLLGAVKLDGILHWERDADLLYRMESHQLLNNLTDVFKSNGYDLIPLRNTINCSNYLKLNTPSCGYFDLRSKHWRIQMYGTEVMANDVMFHNRSNTLLLIDNMWMRGVPNPVRYARNLYGDDVFEHTEHYSDLGFKNGWVPYATGQKWLECSWGKASHNCIDQFLQSGNLQFDDEIWI